MLWVPHFIVENRDTPITKKKVRRNWMLNNMLTLLHLLIIKLSSKGWSRRKDPSKLNSLMLFIRFSKTSFDSFKIFINYTHAKLSAFNFKLTFPAPLLFPLFGLRMLYLNVKLFAMCSLSLSGNFFSMLLSNNFVMNSPGFWTYLKIKSSGVSSLLLRTDNLAPKNIYICLREAFIK